MKITRGSWSMFFICMILGFMLAVQFRSTESLKNNVTYQRVEELSEHLLKAEKERDALKDEVLRLKKESAYASAYETDSNIMKQAGLVALEGPGVIIRLDDSSAVSKAGENPNLYVIHDADLLRVVNELRAAGAEALSINGQRLIATSEIRCAGPTLSVNNVRSAPPFEISAIGDPKNLQNALTMRGGVAETLKVWGISLDVKTSNNVVVPAFKGNMKSEFARRSQAKEE